MAEAVPDPGADRWRQINRMATIARLVGGLAHELNNSLQVMSGLVELLSDRPDLPADVVLRLQKIGGQADRAGAAIRDVLGYTREAAPSRTAVDPATAIETAVALRRYHLGRAGITVHVDAPRGQRKVEARPGDLVQIVLNLILNAEEALTDAGTRELHLQCAGDRDRAQIIVSDTGPGVPAAVADRIFEPFFTTRDPERALGLGLTVARQLAAEYGGDVTLADARQGMTTFVVDLPALQP
ncbi:MAG TPA: HAMP domain-containing sensor histidine kinase [Vicinamibacterales bacterium]